MKQYRKYVTTGVGFSFLVVGITGVIFKLFFKIHPLEEIHGWLGLFLVVAATFHIVQNRGSLKNHLRDGRVFAWLIPILLVIGFFSFAPQETNKGPNPKMVMRKLSHGSVTDVAKVFGKDVNAILESMKHDGLQIRSSDETIEALARENQKRPELILDYFLN